ncbi:S9 family peptidase [Flavobacterium sp. MK4S-17]|uniref:alpha/beta hydrolase family protein n=1 Tax=Flavobacterium sp. MK4S-17 TaxID=2543737 RepID=UPI0013573278|nr:prolyl oligopeptidase family serine peptidase [Flavobacterium sp. MK4S-17]
MIQGFYRYSCSCVLVLCTALVFGQAAPRESGHDPFAGWGALNLQGMSTNGKWLTYSMAYGPAGDTLFLVEADGSRQLDFPSGRSGSFYGERWFACLDNSGLSLVDLENRTVSAFPADAFGFAERKQALFFTKHTSDGNKALRVKNLNGSISLTFPAVEAYSYNSATGKLAIAAKQEANLCIIVLDMDDFSQTEIYSGTASCRSLQWQDKGDALAYILGPAKVNGNDTGELILHRMDTGRSYTLQPNAYPGLIRGTITAGYGPIVISGDASKVYFQIAPEPIADSIKGPEVWNAADRVIYPSKVTVREWTQMPKLAVWAPVENTTAMLTSEQYPSVMLAGNHPYAVLWDPYGNEPSPNMYAPRTYHILDMRTGRISQLLNDGGFAGQLSISPGGKYLSYFRGGDWWAYEFASATHYNLTKSIPFPLFKESFDWPDEPPAYGVMGWSPGDAEIMVYDKYDVWGITPGKAPRRITFGREKGEPYRLVPQLAEQHTRGNYNGSYVGTVRLDRPLLFRVGSVSGAYCMRLASGKFKKFIETDDMLSHGVTDSDGKNLVYIRQNYQTPPVIEIAGLGRAPKVRYRSNKQYYNMQPFRAEKVNYYSSQGERLDGILYYPQQYRPDKKYPMIVHIYEKQAWEMQKFIRPSYDNGAGFNPANYMMDGYFVFLPDISFTGNDANPGEAALDCVEAALESLEARTDIDKDKIGLIGHSFGGYETNYILTRSRRFAVAVSGAAINDIPSFYHFVVPEFKRPNFWHMEYGQFRIGKPYHEDPRGYNQASPLFNSAGINTPLLSWCGKDDQQVPYTQLMSLHLSLRRQGKTHTALLYPGEGHTLSGYGNRQDLTVRIKEWFDYYLKGRPKPLWAEPDKWN